MTETSGTTAALGSTRPTALDGADEAAQLGRLVARGLASAFSLPPGAGVVEEVRLDRLRVELAAVPGESTPALAGRIVDRIAARLGLRAAEVGR